ncbi:chaperonin 10-like protein [Exophiala viscosa]|uniref:Chaperonin 10-like protein n=1 Tax=Exophiala viscosa TaxID=2486360 RepID=A0AAN6IHD2_9EURO|nr:chaperonin 10-like protein [Exophiala viscosa]KAI1629329.1 chaperonin 10-like protein [Exophiala viscosa]
MTHTSKDELPRSMKAHVLEKFNTPYALREVAVPSIEDQHDILIRVDAASYCHTDAVLAAGQLGPESMLPHVGCHEFAGTVVALGSDVQAYQVGDRVAVRGRGYHVCGKCMECMNPSGLDPDEPGYSVYCPYVERGLGVGPGRHGGFREYALVDSRQVAGIPEGMTAVEVAPLMCAGLTVYSALRNCELKPGQRVAIMGCGGGLGHLGLQFAVKMGLNVTGVDVAPGALELAREVGTGIGARIVDARTESAGDVRRAIGQEDGREHLAEMGVDAVLILPESQRAFDYGVELVRNGGIVVVVSFPKDGFHVAASDLVFRRIRVIGSLIGSNKAMRDMFEFCRREGVKAKVKTYAFERLNELVEDYHKGVAGKLVLDLGMKE